MPDAEYVAIGHHLMALMSIKATCMPEDDIEGQVCKSLSKKLKFVERPRPSAMQLHTAFSGIVTFRKGSGEKKPTTTLLGQAMASYNAKQTAKGRFLQTRGTLS